MSPPGATGPARTRIETGLLAAALEVNRTDHARVDAQQHGTAPVISFPSGKRIEPRTAAPYAPLEGTPLIGPPDVPTAVKAAAVRAEALWRNASNQPAGRCPAAAGGPKQLVPSQKVSAAPPAVVLDLNAKLERILGSTGADNGSAGADNGSAGATGATQRYPLRGGTYPVQYAVETLNSHSLSLARASGKGL